MGSLYGRYVYGIEINFMTNKDCLKDYVSPAYPSLVKVAGIESNLKWMISGHRDGLRSKERSEGVEQDDRLGVGWC